MKYLSNHHDDFYSVSRQVIRLPNADLVNQVAIENCKLQFGQQFRRFCTQSCHCAREKLDGWPGGKTSFGKVRRHARG